MTRVFSNPKQPTSGARTSGCWTIPTWYASTKSTRMPRLGPSRSVGWLCVFFFFELFFVGSIGVGWGGFPLRGSWVQYVRFFWSGRGDVNFFGFAFFLDQPLDSYYVSLLYIIYIYIYATPPSPDLPFLAFPISKNDFFPWKNIIFS